MINLTFSQLCAEYAATISEISRLQCLPPQYQRDDHTARLQQQLERKAHLKAEQQRRIREGR